MNDPYLSDPDFNNQFNLDIDINTPCLNCGNYMWIPRKSGLPYQSHLCTKCKFQIINFPSQNVYSYRFGYNDWKDLPHGTLLVLKDWEL